MAPSFRCAARVFPPLHRHAEPMRRFVERRRKSSSALSRHTDSAMNCMACCWIEMCCKVLYHSFRGAFHDELGQDGACHGHGRRDRADEAHRPSCIKRRIHRVPNLRVMPCCTACRRWAATTRPHFPRRMGMSTSQASRGSWPLLLVVIQASSQRPRRQPRLEDMR